jgi:hypothetical protein
VKEIETQLKRLKGGVKLWFYKSSQQFR